MKNESGGWSFGAGNVGIDCSGEEAKDKAEAGAGDARERSLEAATVHHLLHFPFLRRHHGNRNTRTWDVDLSYKVMTKNTISYWLVKTFLTVPTFFPITEVKKRAKTGYPSPTAQTRGPYLAGIR